MLAPVPGGGQVGAHISDSRQDMGTPVGLDGSAGAGPSQAPLQAVFRYQNLKITLQP
jgi:hypothetical protein